MPKCGAPVGLPRTTFLVGLPEGGIGIEVEFLIGIISCEGSPKPTENGTVGGVVGKMDGNNTVGESNDGLFE